MQVETEPSAQPAPGGGRSRRLGGALGRFDPLVPVVGLVSLVVCALRGLDGTVTRDLGVYAYGARQVLAGDPPYVGIENRAGPLAHLLPVPGILAARLVGKDELLGMRAWYLLITVALVVLAYVVVRDVFASRAAGLVSAATTLGFEGLIILATAGPREKTPMMLFIWCAIWTISRRHWLLTGVFVSLATLTLQIAFFPLIAAVLVGVPLLCRTGRLRAFGRIVVGGAIPLLVLVAYFAAAGQVRAFYDGFWLLNARYTSGGGLFAHQGAVWLSMRNGFGWSLVLLFGGLIALLVVTVVRLTDAGRRRDTTTSVLTACAAAAVAGAAWILEDIDSWVDTATFLPFAAVGLAAAFSELEHRVTRRVFLMSAATLVVASTVLAARFSITDRPDTLLEQRAVVQSALRQVPDATMWSIEAPQTLLLAERTNPTRYQMFTGGLADHVDAVWPGGLDGFVTWNLARRPDYITVGKEQLRSGHWRPRIGDEYVVVARDPQAVWFARRSLGPRILAALRRGPDGVGASPGS
jgi:hypothetical protein